MALYQFNPKLHKNQLQFKILDQKIPQKRPYWPKAKKLPHQHTLKFPCLPIMMPPKRETMSLEWNTGNGREGCFWGLQHHQPMVGCCLELQYWRNNEYQTHRETKGPSNYYSQVGTQTHHPCFHRDLCADPFQGNSSVHLKNLQYIWSHIKYINIYISYIHIQQDWPIYIGDNDSMSFHGMRLL